jgi:hypothetical protein
MYLKKRILCRKFPVFKKKTSPENQKKNSKKLPKIVTIAYNLKRWFFYFRIFYILPNLAKYTSGPSPLEQHHKIEKNTLV